MQLRFGQLEKHLKSSLAARKGAWKVKIKNNFSGPEKLFFLFASGKGLPPLQLRFGQLEKHLKSSLAARKGAWKVKIKNNFSGPEKLFFHFASGKGQLCFGQLESTWNMCPRLCSQVNLPIDR